MSREQDLLFCKIAVTNGLVTEEQAKKALNIANQREMESGRRPMIGAIFSKYNLMRQQDVQALYQAVNKRLGISGAPLAGTLTASHRPHGRPRDRKGPPKKIDPTTLWMGIGFGVVFLGIIVGMVIMWFLHDPGTDDDAAAKKSTVASGTETPGGGTGASSTGGGDSGDAADGGGAGATPAAERKMDPEQERKLQQLLRDTRMDYADGNIQRAKGRLEGALKEIDAKKVFVRADLLDQIKRERDDYAKELSGGGDDDDDLGDDL